MKLNNSTPIEDKNGQIQLKLLELKWKLNNCTPIEDKIRQIQLKPLELKVKDSFRKSEDSFGKSFYFYIFNSVHLGVGFIVGN